MRVFFLFLLCVLIYTGFAQSKPGSIRVYVISKNTNEALSLAEIHIYTDSTDIHGATGTDGQYKNSQLTAGKYMVKAACKGYQTNIMKNVPVLPGEARYVTLRLNPDATNTKKADTVEYHIPLIDPSTAGMQFEKKPFLPKLFFKPNSLNFDTLSDYFGNELHIIDTNRVIDYVAKYILANPCENITVSGWFDVNEQNPEELTKQRVNKVINLLMQHGVPEENILGCSPRKRPINSSKEIESAGTENERENLHKANSCVMFRYLRGG